MEPLPGGGFLLGARPSAGPRPDAETPVALGAELRALAEDFSAREVLPFLDVLERGDRPVLRERLRQAGAQGLLAGLVPQEYGGLSLDLPALAAVIEGLAPSGGFAVAVGVHVGIGSLPVLLFGDEAQRRRYLPRLATGEWIAAFALTEPEHGSDALHPATRATPTEDGGFVLDGEKQWITNAGVADLFTVFADVPGRGMTAFLVERETAGVTVGEEWRKMGLHSSSTANVRLSGVRLGPDQVLGAVGRGHRVALPVLDLGRALLAAGGLGLGRALLDEARRYAEGRRQFGCALWEMPLVRAALGEVAVALFALRGALGFVLALLERSRPDFERLAPRLGVETACLKVLGSEALDAAADTAVQVFGGLGYMAGTAVERGYRDARVHRIFEGTNEVLRLAVGEGLLRFRPHGEAPESGAAAPGGEDTQRLASWKRLLLELLTACEVEFGATPPLTAQAIPAELGELTVALLAAEGALGLAAAEGGEAAELAAHLTVRRVARRVLAACERLLPKLAPTPKRAALHRRAWEATRLPLEDEGGLLAAAAEHLRLGLLP